MSHFTGNLRGLRGFGTALLLVVVAAAITAAAGRQAEAAGARRRAPAAGFSNTLYYTLYASGLPDIRKVSVNYNGSNNFTQGTPEAVASIGSADGLIFTPDGDILVGGNQVFKVDIRTGEKVSAQPGSGEAAHIAMDPSGLKAWTSGQPGTLVEVPLNPFGNGIDRPLTGDDEVITAIAFDNVGNAYYTTGLPEGGGSYGRINLNTFVTQRARANVPAAHGLGFNPFTNTLIMVGGTQISQVNPATMQIISTLDLSPNEVILDQGSADGRRRSIPTCQSADCKRCARL